jgi:hypothetical protein
MCRYKCADVPMCQCANYSKFKKSIWNINTKVEYHKPKVLYFFRFDKIIYFLIKSWFWYLDYSISHSNFQEKYFYPNQE